MVKKVHNPVKIDYISCVVEGCLKQIKGAESSSAMDDPEEFVDCWIIEIYKKNTVQQFVKFSKENIPNNEMEVLQNVKKIRTKDGALQLIPCSIECMPDKEELRNLIMEKVSVQEEDFKIIDTLAHVPLTSAVSKEVAMKWSAQYWPLTWRGNPNDQVLNDMQYDMSAIDKFLELVSTKSQEDSSAIPSVSAFVSKRGELIVSYDKRSTTHNPLDHSIMCGIRKVAENLPEDGYLCLDYEVYTTHEPCAMCCMALVHSRISRLFYVQDMPQTGSLKSNFHMHSIKSLNSKYNVFQYIGDKFRAPVVAESVHV